MGKRMVAVASVVALAATGSAWAAAPSNAPRAVVLKVGHTQTFAASKLRPGEEVRCVNDGHVLSVDVPASPAISNGTVWTQAGTTPFHLHVTGKKGGGYVVGCGVGGYHWVPTVAGARHPGQPTESILAI